MPNPDRVKVLVIRERLKSDFAHHAIVETRKPQRSSHCYLLNPSDTVEQRIYVSNEFLNDHTVEEIQDLLKEWHLRDAIRAAGDRVVVVTNRGIRVEAEWRGPGQP